MIQSPDAEQLPDPANGAPLPSGGSRQLGHRVGLIIGILLLAGAIVMVVRHRGDVIDAFDKVKEMSSGRLAFLISVMFATIVANIVLTGAMFSMLISRFGRVGVMEMQALIASSTLLNFLPMRAGMISRVAYHKAYNAIPVRHSVRVIIEAVALTGASAGALGIAVWLTGKSPVPMWLLAFIPLALAVMVWLLASALSQFFSASNASTARAHLIQLLTLAFVFRYLDMLVLAFRYILAFALIGHSIDFRGATGFACLGALTTMVPLLSNGLGLREWAVGWITPMLTPHSLALGVTADLLNRAAEILVAVPAGLIGMAALGKVQRGRKSASC